MGITPGGNVGSAGSDYYMAGGVNFTAVKGEIEKAKVILEGKLRDLNGLIFAADTDPVFGSVDPLHIRQKEKEELQAMLERLTKLKDSVVFTENIFNLFGSNLDSGKIRAYKRSAEEYYESEKKKDAAVEFLKTPPVEHVAPGYDKKTGTHITVSFDRPRDFTREERQPIADFEKIRQQFEKTYGMPNPIINGTSIKENLAAVQDTKKYMMEKNPNKNAAEIYLCGNLGRVLKYVYNAWNGKAASA